jgi:predicted acyltransferase
MKTKERLISLDVFRGVTIALMIMVNQPGSWKFKYNQMRHAQWHGCTLTDLIFPFFLVIIGVACWYAFQKYEQRLTLGLVKKIVRRAFLIFIIGIFLNFFKEWISLGQVNLSTLRITGVLQRIAVCYAIGTILCIALKPNQVLITSFGILVLYWVIVSSASGPDPFIAKNSIVGKIDILLLGENHLRKGYPIDTAGLFASLPATVHVIWGYLLGMIIYKSNDQKKLILKMFLLGISAILISQVWNYVFPINKTLWTSSYVMYTSGWAIITFAFLIWIIDVRKKIKYFTPFLAFGVNSLFAYIFAELCASFFSGFLRFPFEGNLVSFKSFMFNFIFSPILGEMNGSLFYSVFIMLFYWSILWFMHKKKIYVKV